MANSEDPDQLANWSGSTLFAKTGHAVFNKRRVKWILSGIMRGRSWLLCFSLFCDMYTVFHGWFAVCLGVIDWLMYTDFHGRFAICLETIDWLHIYWLSWLVCNLSWCHWLATCILSFLVGLQFVLVSLIGYMYTVFHGWFAICLGVIVWLHVDYISWLVCSLSWCHWLATCILSFMVDLQLVFVSLIGYMYTVFHGCFAVCLGAIDWLRVYCLSWLVCSWSFCHWLATCILSFMVGLQYFLVSLIGYMYTVFHGWFVICLGVIDWLHVDCLSWLVCNSSWCHWLAICILSSLVGLQFVLVSLIGYMYTVFPGWFVICLGVIDWLYVYCLSWLVCNLSWCHWLTICILSFMLSLQLLFVTLIGYMYTIFHGWFAVCLGVTDWLRVYCLSWLVCSWSFCHWLATCILSFMIDLQLVLVSLIGYMYTIFHGWFAVGLFVIDWLHVYCLSWLVCSLSWCHWLATCILSFMVGLQLVFLSLIGYMYTVFHGWFAVCLGVIDWLYVYCLSWLVCSLSWCHWLATCTLSFMVGLQFVLVSLIGYMYTVFRGWFAICLGVIDWLYVYCLSWLVCNLSWCHRLATCILSFMVGLQFLFLSLIDYMYTVFHVEFAITLCDIDWLHVYCLSWLVCSLSWCHWLAMCILSFMVSLQLVFLSLIGYMYTVFHGWFAICLGVIDWLHVYCLSWLVCNLS